VGTSHFFQITLAGASSACAFVALSAVSLAQNQLPDVACRKTETQAECHARLKCKPDEELEDCQKRLLKCRANEGLADCQKRVGAEPAKKGHAGERDDRNKEGGDREADKARDREAEDQGRDRFGDENGGDRGNAQREGRERRDRGEGARRRRQGNDGGQGGYAASKTFGLGLELGEPTGLNGKYFFSESVALDFGIGWIYGHYYYGDGLHLYADILWHPISLASASAFELPLYIGGGLRYWEFEYCDQRVCGYNGSTIGIRIPIGIAFDFNNVPLDVFLQLVPVIDFVSGDYYDRYRDREHFGVDLSAGIRYWFK
jgi:hypothetical protein